MADQKGGTATTNVPDSSGDGSAGARSPEELETLLEDALLTGDRNTLVDLFEAGAVLSVAGDLTVRHAEAIADSALARWTGDQSYVADPQEVIQARDIALVVTGRGTNVALRGQDGAWRYVIVRQSGDDAMEGSDDGERRSGPGVGTGGRRQQRR